ncbi:MAG: acyl-CoA dehydrogenase family protein [Bacteroidales bacterium]|jgi:alkylation response protein AidB-like acyl-CoA dehydrogenase|nr:acyl-CoA dehydrogenase family protein [Bacteroidales bacterium]
MANNFFTDNEGLKFHLHNELMEEIIRLKEKDYADFGKFDYAPENYNDAIDSYEKVLDIVGEITGEVLAVNAEEIDHEGPQVVDNAIVYAKGTTRNHEALTNAGLYGMSLPRQYGGLNFSYVPYVMAAEIVSRGDCAFANIWGLQDCAETIYEFGSEEIKNEYLPRINKGATCSMDLTEPDAGSDLQAVGLKASLDENNCWRLNGVKRFITNGDADIKLVLARSEEGTTDARGLSYFVYDRNSNAITIRRIENKLGIKGSPTAELVFNNAPAKLVGDRKLGLIKYVMTLMNGARLGVGAQSVGLAEAAYREALQYAHEREQFGKAIKDFPQVYEMLANMRAKIDASRTLLYETARAVDMTKSLDALSKDRTLQPEERQTLKKYQRLADMLTPLVKLFSSEFANQVCYDTIQVYGGSGFMKDYPVERMYRDARILTIYEGTSQLQVVAAIRGIIQGTYLSRIKEYEEVAVKPEYQAVRDRLIKMRERFETMVAKANEFGTTSESYDFNARRLVEAAGYLIMCNLLLIDANKNDMFASSCAIFSKYAQAELEKSAAYIENFDVSILDSYKSVFME